MTTTVKEDTTFNPSQRKPNKRIIITTITCEDCYYENRKKTKPLRCRFCIRNFSDEHIIKLKGFLKDDHITKKELKARGIPT